MARSPLEELASLPADRQAAWLATQPAWAVHDMARGAWWWTGRPEQQAPPGNWFVWLLLSGRGFGKTRSAAEWLIDRALRYPVDTSGFRTEWLLIATTLSDAMRQCVGGPAGIRRVLERRLGPAARGQPNGWWLVRSPKVFVQFYDGEGNEAQVIYIESADNEDAGRGYNAAGGWLDEFAKWPKPDGSWTEGIMPSMRADIPGDYPRVIVATTPKMVVQLVEWQRRTDGSVHLTRGSTYDNASNLAAPVLAELHRRYHGTRLGQQELHGQLIEEVEGALWRLEWIERFRVQQTPPLVEVVIGMDPAGSGTRDETGLIAAGRGVDNVDYVLGDWSRQVAGYAAAYRAWEMYRKYEASWLVVEDNMAKAWLYDVLRRAYEDMVREGLFPSGGSAPIKTVTAKVGKRLRAEPIAARYEQQLGLVRHAAGLADLETQMISWVPGETADSPDRVDALVYALMRLGGRDRRTSQVMNPGKAFLPTSPLSPLSVQLPRMPV